MSEIEREELLESMRKRLAGKPQLVRLLSRLVDYLENLPESECESAIRWLAFVHDSPLLAQILYNITRLSDPVETIFEALPANN